MAKKETVKSNKSLGVVNIPKPLDVGIYALEEVTLLKDHGFDKKGTKLNRHPNTAYILKIKGIAK